MAEQERQQDAAPDEQGQDDSFEARWAREMAALDEELSAESPDQPAADADAEEEEGEDDIAAEAARLVAQLKADAKEAREAIAAAKREREEQRKIDERYRKFMDLAKGDEAMMALIERLPPDTDHGLAKFEESIKTLRQMRDALVEDRKRIEEKVRTETLRKVETRIGKDIAATDFMTRQDEPPQLQKKLEEGDFHGYLVEKLDGFV